MKKLVVYGVALAMLLFLCACGASDGQKNKDNAGNSASTSKITEHLLSQRNP